MNQPGVLPPAGLFAVAADPRVQVLISADFMYYYVKALISGRAMTMPATQVPAISRKSGCDERIAHTKWKRN